MHPVTEFAVATVVVFAVGAGAIAVLPQAGQALPQTIALDASPAPASRAAPAAPKTNAERIEALQAELAAVAAEHKRLAGEVKRAARERSAR